MFKNKGINNTNNISGKNFESRTCLMDSTNVTVFPVPGGPNSM